MPTTEVNPAGVSALGTTKVAFVSAKAGAIPTTAEMASNGINVSFYIPGSQFPVVGNQNTGDDVRLGSVQVYNRLGQKSYTVDDIQYVFDPQTPGAGTPAATLIDGYTGFLVVRYGPLATVDWAVAQKIDIYPVTLGVRWKTETSQDEFGLITYSQKIVVSGAAQTDVAFAS